jgi:hypothetical protein
MNFPMKKWMIMALALWAGTVAPAYCWLYGPEQLWQTEFFWKQQPSGAWEFNSPSLFAGSLSVKSLMTGTFPQKSGANEIELTEERAEGGAYPLFQFENSHPLEVSGPGSRVEMPRPSNLLRVYLKVQRKDAGNEPLHFCLEISYGQGLRKRVTVTPAATFLNGSESFDLCCLLLRSEMGDAPFNGTVSIESKGPWSIVLKNVTMTMDTALFPLTEEENVETVQYLGSDKLTELTGLSGQQIAQIERKNFIENGHSPLHHFACIGEVRWKEVTGAASLQATGTYPVTDGQPVRFCQTVARDPQGQPLQLRGSGAWVPFILPVEHADLLARDDIPNAQAAQWAIDQTLTGSGVVFVRRFDLVEYPDENWEKLPSELKAAWGTGPIPLPPRVMPWVRWARQIHLRERWGSGAVGFLGGLLLGAGGVALVVRARRRRFLLQREEELRRIASHDAFTP